MKTRQFGVGLISLFLFTVLSYVVYAQNLLNDALGPLAGLDVGATYIKYWYVIDTIMYAIILIGAAQFSLSKSFEGRGGKAVIIGVGISLAIAAAYFERKYNFMLIERLGPLAIIIVVILFLFAVYRMFTALGGEARHYGMLGFALSFFYLQAQFPEIGQWVRKTDYGLLTLAWGLLNIFAVIFFGWGLWELIQDFRGGGGDRGNGGDGGNGREPRPRPPRRRAPGPTPGQAVPVPQITQVHNADGAVIIQWNNPGGVDGYIISRGGLAFPPINDPNQTVYVDVVGGPGTHDYTVQAFRNGMGARHRFRRWIVDPAYSAPSTPAGGTSMPARAAIDVGPWIMGGASLYYELHPAAGTVNFGNNHRRTFTMYLINNTNSAVTSHTVEIMIWPPGTPLAADRWLAYPVLPVTTPLTYLSIVGINNTHFGAYTTRRGNPYYNTSNLV